MFDPLLKQLAAKAKAVGLIAGTAMVTTALVGGGAVALTTVSHDGDLVEDAVVVASPSPSADSDSADSPLPLVDSGLVAATPTVGIEVPDEGEDTGKVRPPLPADFTCDDSKNHGQNVSAYAKSLPKGPGRGEKVSAVAQSDCGKKADDDVATAEAEDVEEADEVETEEVEEPRTAKAEKPAKASTSGKGRSGKSGKGGGKNKR